ncbi:MAG: DUF4235 domain-containing protein [Solirubrobacteraceae bacterium]
MGKLAFTPFSVGSGLVAGFAGRRLFSLLWGLVDDEEPPRPEHREVPWGKLAIAVTLEAAVFALTRAAVDHGARQAFYRATGSWPGDESPDAR